MTADFKFAVSGVFKVLTGPIRDAAALGAFLRAGSAPTVPDGEVFAPGSVPLNANQTQSFFRHPDLVPGEFESVLINPKRAVELFEQGVGKPLAELANQRVCLASFRKSKTTYV